MIKLGAMMHAIVCGTAPEYLCKNIFTPVTDLSGRSYLYLRFAAHGLFHVPHIQTHSDAVLSCRPAVWNSLPQTIRNTPSYSSSLLSHYKPTRQLRSSSSNFLVQPPSKTKFWLSCISHRCTSDLEWPASRCQVITFLSDLQENAQNSLFPQPSHLGHVLVLRLRFIFDWPTRTLPLWRK